MTGLKSPWILGEVLETSLNVAAWKVFFDAFWLSKIEYESWLREVNGYLHKVLNVLCNNLYQFKTGELKNVEKLVKETVQALKSY